MRKAMFTLVLSLTTSAFAAGNPVDNWANAVGGRDKVASIKTIYREATVQIAGMEGTIKVWHSTEGKYRKEEQVGIFSTIEQFDGTNGCILRGSAPLRKMEAPELELARSAAYANSNSMFYVFFPDRRRGGALDVDSDGTIVMKPAGGVDWRITLDPQTSLPKTMIHQQGEHTITVTFVDYETIDGIKFEKAIHRTTGDPRFDADIKFTKTVINPPLPPNFFTPIPSRETP